MNPGNLFELNELEIMELIDERDRLLEELDDFNDGTLQITDLRELEIYDRLDEINEQLDILY